MISNDLRPYKIFHYTRRQARAEADGSGGRTVAAIKIDTFAVKSGWPVLYPHCHSLLFSLSASVSLFVISVLAEEFKFCAVSLCLRPIGQMESHKYTRSVELETIRRLCRRVLWRLFAISLFAYKSPDLSSSPNATRRFSRVS